MGKIVVRAIANVIILIGFFLLGRVLYYGLSGVLAQQYFGPSPGSGIQNIYALGLGLPIPLHVIAVGLVLQLRWDTVGDCRVRMLAGSGTGNPMAGFIGRFKGEYTGISTKAIILKN